MTRHLISDAHKTHTSHTQQMQLTHNIHTHTKHTHTEKVLSALTDGCPRRTLHWMKYDGVGNGDDNESARHL